MNWFKSKLREVSREERRKLPSFERLLEEIKTKELAPMDVRLCLKEFDRERSGFRRLFGNWDVGKAIAQLAGYSVTCLLNEGELTQVREVLEERGEGEIKVAPVSFDEKVRKAVERARVQAGHVMEIDKVLEEQSEEWLRAGFTPEQIERGIDLLDAQLRGVTERVMQEDKD